MLERTKSLLEHSKPASFAYDHSRRLFLSGEREFTVHDLPLEFGDLAADSDTETNPIPESPLVQTLLKPVMLPQMYNWLNENMTRDLLDDTAEVIRDVYIDLVLVPKDSRYPVPKSGGSFMGFTAERLRNDHPHFVLTTLGNCACLGVDVDGIWGDEVWEESMASFGFHNIDNYIQEKSLLAGLGHVAYRASQDN